jgi:NurA-like 5'-3' nuclease
MDETNFSINSNIKEIMKSGKILLIVEKNMMQDVFHARFSLITES